MAHRTAALVLTCTVLALALSSGGCATSEAEQQRLAEARDAETRFVLGPLVDEDGARRSLALDSPEMNELYELQPWLDERTARHYDRLDRRAGVQAGTRRTLLLISETTVRDQFSSSNGQVQDNFNRNTTRDTVIEVVR